MTELSGFSAVQPVANLAPQALQLPTSLAEVCQCESNCASSRMLKGFVQIVRKGLTNLIEINIQSVPTPDGVQVAVIPWDRDGVAKNGVALPGGYIAIDGTKVVGMSPEQHAEWIGVPLPALEPATPETAPTPEPGDAPTA